MLKEVLAICAVRTTAEVIYTINNAHVFDFVLENQKVDVVSYGLR